MWFVCFGGGADGGGFGFFDDGVEGVGGVGGGCYRGDPEGGEGCFGCLGKTVSVRDYRNVEKGWELTFSSSMAFLAFILSS